VPPGRAQLRSLAERARREGVLAALSHAARRAAAGAAAAVTDARLEREQRRGVLGPAHRAWGEHSASENRRRWTSWDWTAHGEEWTASPEWKRALIEEVLLPRVPVGAAVLEIGAGGGRWSEVLLERAGALTLVDVTPHVLDVLRERFGTDPRVTLVLSGGADLPGVPDRSVDVVWSFDVFVHVAPVDQAGYLAEIARVLRPGGTALIHHADGRNRGRIPSRGGWRSPMSAHLFAALARERGLTVAGHVRAWAGGRHGFEAYGDVITVLSA
jgi:SAM-dependent methyltransferase